MRTGPIVNALLLASSMVTTGCGSTTGGGGAAGAGGTSNTGGAVGTGGRSSAGGAGGTGGTSSNGTSVTTLGDTKSLNALSAAEITQLCKDTYAYFGKAVPMATACQYKGLSFATSSSAPSDSQFQQICRDQETTCTQAGTGLGSADNPGCSDIPSSCTATVAQYSACVSDELVAFNQGMIGLPSCATATSAVISAVWRVMAPTPPASCDSLSVTCPELSPPNPSY
jgi:hypothetical protein